MIDYIDYRFEYFPGPVGQLRIKKAENQNEFEKEIDDIVYRLYDIFPDEQKIIEGIEREFH